MNSNIVYAFIILITISIMVIIFGESESKLDVKIKIVAWLILIVSTPVLSYISWISWKNKS